MKRVGLLAILTVSLLVLFIACTRPVPDHNNIIFYTKSYSDPSINPEPSGEVVEKIRQAIHRLAGDPDLTGHPVHSYLHDPNLQ